MTVLKRFLTVWRSLLLAALILGMFEMWTAKTHAQYVDAKLVVVLSILLSLVTAIGILLKRAHAEDTRMRQVSAGYREWTRLADLQKVRPPVV